MSAQPNIVFVLFDDLGWTDISYNGGQLITPNIDSLFTESINLNRHYIHLICSISRSQFLTGRYAMYSGYGKSSPFGDGQIGGIPVGIPTFAQWLKSYNSDYTNYAIGKWMVGYSMTEQLPKSRGFDHFFGSYTSAFDPETGKIVANKCDGCNPDRYDLHNDDENWQIQQANSLYDFRDQMFKYIDVEIEKNQQNDYSSPFYMYFPLQTPHGPLPDIEEYEEICDSMIGEMKGNKDTRGHRWRYCEAMLAMDDIIGEMVDKLEKDAKIWDNTIFILSSDNGADTANNGCNYPLRGTKGTIFEGNQRVPTLIGGGLIPKSQHGTTRDSLFSSLDWTPTLLAFAGIYDFIDEKDRTWDGINQYNLIMYGDDYQDREDHDHLVFNIGTYDLSDATIIFKYGTDTDKLFKYASKTKKISIRLDGWCIPKEDTNEWDFVVNDMDLNPNLLPETQDIDGKFLFDLTEDISEMNNILIKNPHNKYNKKTLVEYAENILKPYTENAYFSEPINGLWDRYSEEEDKAEKDIDGKDGDKQYLHAWIDFVDYKQLINDHIDEQIEKHNNPISDELRLIYNKPWQSPVGSMQENEFDVFKFMDIKSKSHTDLYTLIIVICAIIVLMVIFQCCPSKSERFRYTAIK